jgi:hypothetical protein
LIHHWQYLPSAERSCLLTDIFQSSSLDAVHMGLHRYSNLKVKRSL